MEEVGTDRKLRRTAAEADRAVRTAVAADRAGTIFARERPPSEAKDETTVRSAFVHIRWVTPVSDGWSMAQCTCGNALGTSLLPNPCVQGLWPDITRWTERGYGHYLAQAKFTMQIKSPQTENIEQQDGGMFRCTHWHPPAAFQHPPAAFPCSCARYVTYARRHKHNLHQHSCIAKRLPHDRSA